MLSKIELLCDDKNVGRVLRSLAGVAVGTPSVVPVINAHVDESGKVVKAKTSGSTPELWEEWVKKNKINKEVDIKTFRAFCSDHGMSETSANYVKEVLVERGLVKRVGKGRTAKYFTGEKK